MVKTFAKIQNGIVTNLVVAEDFWPFTDDPHIEVPEGLRIELGWEYENDTFSEPAKEVFIPPIQTTAITPLQFFDHLSEKEQLAIVTATFTIPQVKIWYDRLFASDKVTISDIRLLSGLKFMVTSDLLTQVKCDELLELIHHT